jgi:orotate phosphoribosyltransferase
MKDADMDGILTLFKEADALLQGHFKLTSGRHSEWYFGRSA